MTTVKRLICSLLLALTVLPLLASCVHKVSEDALSTLQKLQDEVGSYDVIVADGADADTLSAAQLMAQSISKRTGIECGVLNESAMSPSAHSFRVLVGDTSLQESAEALYGLKRDDYVCRFFGTALVIGGRSGRATYAAVRRYVEEVLPLCEPTRIVCDGCEFEYRCEYQIEDILIGGVSLEAYTYVFDGTNGDAVHGLAHSLRELVADKCGIYPDVVASSKKKDGQREVFISVSGAKTGIYEIGFDGEDAFIVSDTVYGLSVAIERYYRMLTDNTQGEEVSLDAADAVSSPYSCCSPELMMALMSLDRVADLHGAAQGLADKIDCSESSVIALGSFEREAWDTMTYRLPDRFSVELGTLSDGRVVPVLFDSLELDVRLKSTRTCVGVSVMIFELRTRSGGGEMDLIIFFGSSATSEDVSFINEVLSSNTNPYVASVMLFEDADALLDVGGNGISVEYNSAVKMGDQRCRYAVFSRRDGVICSDVRESVSEELFTRFIHVKSEERYCKAYTELIN